LFSLDGFEQLPVFGDWLISRRRGLTSAVDVFSQGYSSLQTAGQTVLTRALTLCLGPFERPDSTRPEEIHA